MSATDPGRTDAGWLTDDIVDAVTAHMNGDHAEDNVVICRGVGNTPETTAAVMTGLDVHGIEFTATTPAGEQLVRIPFRGAPLAERAEIRAEVAAFFHESNGTTDSH